MDNFLFVDLSSLTPGKPFAGFAAGSFVDMNGREVEFKPSALKAFLANTLKVLKAARDKGMPGLPIDARGHDKGDAAGWIVGAELGEVEDSDGGKVGVIMLAAEWTKLGVELLRDKIMANFSPTVDLRGKAIRGGSLTNWPASVDGNGAPLFPAVELAEGMYRRATSDERRVTSDEVELEESLDDRLNAIRDAWYEAFGRRVPESWVIETFNEYLIVAFGGETYRVAYSEAEDGFTFAGGDEWVKVEQAWVEAQLGRKLTDAELGRTARGASGQAGAAGDAAEGSETGERGEVIDMTREEMQELIAQQVKETMAAELQQFVKPAGSAGADGQPGFDVLEFLDMGGTRDEVKEAFRQRMMEEHELMQKQAKLEAAEMIGRIRREADIADFAQGVTGGTPETPYGLPVDAKDLQEFLGRLQPGDLVFAKKMLGDFQAHGRRKFAELGHGKQGQGGQELPAVYARQLDRGELTVADLAEPELGLGELGQYDLSKWGGK